MPGSLRAWHDGVGQKMLLAALIGANKEEVGSTAQRVIFFLESWGLNVHEVEWGRCHVESLGI